MARSRFISRLSAVFGLAGVAAASVSGCGGGGSSSSGGGNSGSTGAVVTVGTTAGRAACAANAHTAGRARWTVLVYLNSSNNLNDGDPGINNISDALHNIAQMATVGSDANVNIVVQWKQANYGDTQQTPTFNETRRYLIKPHSASDINQILAGNTTVLDPDLLSFNSAYYNQNTKQVDMGDWHVLQDFVNWGSTTYPADNLAVVVWDHGSGWEPVPAQYRSVRKPLIRRAVSLDSQTHNEIETEQIPGALAQAAQPIDALIFDASLMQMAEIEYEVRNTAKIMVGSEESPPGAGYPYDQWIGDLKTDGSTPCAAGISIVNRFVNNYANTDGITQSVIDLSKMQAVVTALDNFGALLIAHRTDQAPIIQNARNNAQAYKYPEFKDLYDFAGRIRATATATDLQQAATNLQNAMISSSGAIIASGHNQNEPGSNGMSITVPDPTLNLSIANSFTSYLTLAVSQQGAAPHWYQFCVQQVQ